MSSGRLAVVELAQETHPPFVLALNLDPRAPQEAREMAVSAGASLLLYGLREGREVRAEAGPQRMPFPEEVTPDSILTWCAGLQASKPTDPEGASVEIRPPSKRSILQESRDPPIHPRLRRLRRLFWSRATDSPGRRDAGCRRKKRESS